MAEETPPEILSSSKQLHLSLNWLLTPLTMTVVRLVYRRRFALEFYFLADGRLAVRDVAAMWWNSQISAEQQN